MKQLTGMLLIAGLIGLTVSCTRGKMKLKRKPLESERIVYWIKYAEIKNAPIYFKANCVSCHLLNRQLIGPPMKGMMDRLPGREWLKSYIIDERSLLKSGDTTALRISKQSSFEPFHRFINLTDETLDELIHYTK
ncbi:MAG TPA: c-type cytochrome [Fluviicola sp.]|nr:c-type cytochrome [Fluviicola sp.]